MFGGHGRWRSGGSAELSGAQRSSLDLSRLLSVVSLGSRPGGPSPVIWVESKSVGMAKKAGQKVKRRGKCHFKTMKIDEHI